MANDYVIPRGSVYFDRWDSSDAPTGERAMGNAPGFTLNISSESVEHYSSESGLRTKDLDVVVEVIRAATLTVDNMSEDNVALFAIADQSTVAQTATPVSAEAIAGVNQGRYYQLGQSASNPTGVRGVGSVTVTGSGGTPSYDVSDDYTVDAALGRLYIVPGGAITDGTDIEVNYTPEANSRSRLASAQVAQLTGSLRVIAANAKGTNRDYYFPKVTLKPSGELPIITEEAQVVSMQFELEALLKDASTAALYIDGRAVAS